MSDKNLHCIVRFDGFEVFEFRPQGIPTAFVADEVGHSKNGQGAYSPLIKLSEWEFARVSAKNYGSICADNGIAADIYVREEAGWNGWKKLKNELNRRHQHVEPYLIHIMDHYDWNVAGWKNGEFFPDRAHGGHCRYWHTSKKGKVAAEIFARHSCAHFGVHKRWNHGLKRGERANHLVRHPFPPSIIIEKGFGANVEDAKKLLAGRDTYHKAYLMATIECLNAL